MWLLGTGNSFPETSYEQAYEPAHEIMASVN